jgi:hypothetical protein
VAQVQAGLACIQRRASQVTMVLWSPSAAFFTPIRPLTNSNVTVSGAADAIVSNSSTVI